VLRAIEWILLATAGCTAIIVGVRRHRPARIGPWLLMAGSMACMGAGDVFYALGRTAVAEIFYLAVFVMVAAALAQFTRGGSLLVDRARLLDLLAFTCASLLVIWVFVTGASGEIGEISAADVLGDLLLIAVATRVILAVGRNVAAALLLTGGIGMLAGDLMLPFAPLALTEIGYIVFYVTWGLAALHPSMTRLTQPMPSRPTPWRGRWAALLAASVATPPAALLIESLSGGPVRDGVVIAVAGAITLLLTFTRLADSVTQNTRALARERGLRVASAALVSAADQPAVDEAVRSAVAQLMPSNTPTVVFATDDRQLGTGTTAPPSQRTAPGSSSTTGPLTPSASTARPGAPAPHSRPDRPTRSWWTTESADESTLVCPLWLEPLAVARPSGGALILTGRSDVLAATRDALEVLAGQAALALDRISLVEAVGRRDSDLYLRAVIRNTADLMLVIDDDQRIRYASPALRDLLGDEELSPLATLGDLVHPDDRGQIRRALLADGDGTLFCSLRRPDHSQVLVEATYRDLRADRLVQGFVVTMRSVTDGHDPAEQVPHLEHVDELPAWVNRRSAQHKFRY
jgi:PAS domain S-box-containing protein